MKMSNMPSGAETPPRKQRMSKRKRYIISGVIVILLIGVGAGVRVSDCSICAVQGPITVTWFRLPVYSPMDDSFEFDEYRTMELWEDIYGEECEHV